MKIFCIFQLETTTQRLADISADAIKKDRLLDEERIAFEKDKEEMKTTIQELRHTNELLHSQVQSYGSKINKFEEMRANSLISSGTTPALSSSSSSSTTQELPNILSVSTSEEELIELRHNMSDLREAMRYLKRERDTMELKLSVSENEVNRIQGALATTQKLLDESRVELKRELDKRLNIHDESSYAKLMSEVTQLNIVRESNAHLRAENEQLFKKISDLTNSLNSIKNETSPLKDKIRTLESEKVVLEAEVLRFFSFKFSITH